MNVLINGNGSAPYHFKERKENLEGNTFGDVFAFSLISTITLAALTISVWSAFLLFTGNTSGGGPIGYIFKNTLLSMIM